MPDADEQTESPTPDAVSTGVSPQRADGDDERERLVPDQIAPGQIAPGQRGSGPAGEPGGAAGDLAERSQADEENAVTSPAKVMRIGSMVRQLLEEVRQAPLDEASRERLAEVYERSVTELSEALSEDLADELRNLALPFSSDTPSESELRVAKAQLVGWLEGLFHGIQATLFAQQLAARQQFEQMRQLPPTGGQPGQAPGDGGVDPSAGTPGGVYL